MMLEANTSKTFKIVSRQAIKIVYTVNQIVKSSDTQGRQKLCFIPTGLSNFEGTSAMNCMHECLWKILSQDCPHGEVAFSTSMCIYNVNLQ